MTHTIAKRSGEIQTSAGVVPFACSTTVEPAWIEVYKALDVCERKALILRLTREWQETIEAGFNDGLHARENRQGA